MEPFRYADMSPAAAKVPSIHQQHPGAEGIAGEQQPMPTSADGNMEPLGNEYHDGGLVTALEGGNDDDDDDDDASSLSDTSDEGIIERNEQRQRRRHLQFLAAQQHGGERVLMPAGDDDESEEEEDSEDSGEEENGDGDDDDDDDDDDADGNGDDEDGIELPKLIAQMHKMVEDDAANRGQQQPPPLLQHTTTPNAAQAVVASPVWGGPFDSSNDVAVTSSLKFVTPPPTTTTTTRQRQAPPRQFGTTTSAAAPTPSTTPPPFVSSFVAGKPPNFSQPVVPMAPFTFGNAQYSAVSNAAASTTFAQQPPPVTVPVAPTSFQCLDGSTNRFAVPKLPSRPPIASTTFSSGISGKGREQTHASHHFSASSLPTSSTTADDVVVRPVGTFNTPVTHKATTLQNVKSSKSTTSDSAPAFSCPLPVPALAAPASFDAPTPSVSPSYMVPQQQTNLLPASPTPPSASSFAIVKPSGDPQPQPCTAATKSDAASTNAIIARSRQQLCSLAGMREADVEFCKVWLSQIHGENDVTNEQERMRKFIEVLPGTVLENVSAPVHAYLAQVPVQDIEPLRRFMSFCQDATSASVRQMLTERAEAWGAIVDDERQKRLALEVAEELAATEKRAVEEEEAKKLAIMQEEKEAPKNCECYDDCKDGNEGSTPPPVRMVIASNRRIVAVVVPAWSVTAAVVVGAIGAAWSFARLIIGDDGLQLAVETVMQQLTGAQEEEVVSVTPPPPS